MIELNLLEKKEPFKLPSVAGVDLNIINFKMFGVALFIYYVPGMFLEFSMGSKLEEANTHLSTLKDQNDKLKNEIGKEANVKDQLGAYKVQESKLRNRSAQVDEILKYRTNPKKILEKIARSIPEDLWLNELLVSDKNEVTINGGAYSSRAIGEFITNINDSPYFGGSITPSKQENKQELVDGLQTSYDIFELKGKIINYDMRKN